jgi:HEAT repeat protein
MVFGEAGSSAPAVHQALHGFLGHADPGVREEAAWALCRVHGASEEQRFLALLEDPDMGVRKRAVRCLRAIRSGQALDPLVAILAQAAKDPALDPLESHVCSALPDIAEAAERRGGEAERVLVERLRAGHTTGLRALLRGSQRPLDDNSFFAVCKALGAIGTEPSRQLLGELARRVKPPGRQELERAIARIPASDS